MPSHLSQFAQRLLTTSEDLPDDHRRADAVYAAIVWDVDWDPGDVSTGTSARWVYLDPDPEKTPDWAIEIFEGLSEEHQTRLRLRWALENPNETRDALRAEAREAGLRG